MNHKTKAFKRWLGDRPRLRTTIFCGGTIGVLLCTGLFFLSLYFMAALGWSCWVLKATDGAIAIGYLETHCGIYVPEYFWVPQDSDSVIWWPEIKQTKKSTTLYIPLWLTCVLCFAAAFIAYRIEPRSLHQCRHCDYDLTGNTSGRCSECGTDISEQA